MEPAGQARRRQGSRAIAAGRQDEASAADGPRMPCLEVV